MSEESLSHPSEGELSISSSRSSVAFSTIEFHEHAMVLGDNPSTSTGPSIEIDWTVQSHAVVGIEEYESMRLPRRKKDQLIMPGSMRTSLLLDNGYTLREIRETSSRRSSASSGGKSKVTKAFSKLLPSRFSSK